jgi:hypothetical protein
MASFPVDHGMLGLLPCAKNNGSSTFNPVAHAAGGYQLKDTHGRCISNVPTQSCEPTASHAAPVNSPVVDLHTRTVLHTNHAYESSAANLSAACTAAMATLVTLPYVMITAKIQGDLKKVTAAADAALQCTNTMRPCMTAMGKTGECCDIEYNWLNYTSDVDLLTAKGNEASGVGGKSCFMKNEVVTNISNVGLVQTDSFPVFPVFFPAACLNDADMTAYQADQSATCTAATGPPLVYCNQTYAC